MLNKPTSRTGLVPRPPHPKALKNMLTQSKPATDEVAVMIDARDGLDITAAARAVEWEGYVNSWNTADVNPAQPETC